MKIIFFYLLIILSGMNLFFVGASLSSEAENIRTIDFDTSVRLALNNSYEILIAQEEIVGAASQLENAKRGYYPKVRLQSSTRADLFNFDEWTSEDISTGLALDWDPYQGGELMRRNAEAKVNYYIAKLNRENAVLGIVVNIQELYFDLLKAQYSLDSDALSLEIEKQKLDTLEEEFKSGRIKESDVLSARTDYYEKELAFEKAKQAYEIKIINLQNKLQKKDFEKVEDVERSIPEDLEISLDSCIKTAYLNENKYLIAKEQEKLARLAVKYSRLKRLPTFSFFTTNDYAIDQAFGEDFDFRVGIIATYPLYDAGETRSIIKSSESRLRRATLDLRKEKETRALEVTEKYYKLKNQIELLKITREKEKRFQQDWSRAEMDYKNGSISKIEYDKFRHAYLLSTNRIKELELDVMLSQSSLLRAIGITNFSRIIK